MKVVQRIYTDSETNDEMRLEESVLRGLTGTTVNSGIEPDTPHRSSPSMTQDVGSQIISFCYPIEEGESTERIPDKTLLLWPGLEGWEYRGLYTVRQVPEGVREQLRSLLQHESEGELYEIADSIANWVTEASGAEQAALAAELSELRSKDVRVLLSALADSEVQLRSERLLHTIAGFLDSDDKRLAQAAALCLLQCGGGLGGTLIRFRLDNPASLPHVELILGAINLLAAN